MADYPTLPIYRGPSHPKRSSGRDESLSVGGTMYIRSFYDADRLDFEFTHKGLSATDYAALVAHYDAHRTATFSFTWPHSGVTYTGMRYGKDGLVERVSDVAFRHDVTVRLVSA